MFDAFDIGDLIRIEWIDSGIALHGWQSAEDLRRKARGAAIAVTVGHYLGFSTEEIVLVAQTRDISNEDYLNAQAIYTPCVKRVTLLEPA